MTSLQSSKFKEKLVAAVVTFTYNNNTTMETFGILIDTIVTNMKMLNLLNGLLPESKDEKINSVLAKCDYCANSKDEQIKAAASQCLAKRKLGW